MCLCCFVGSVHGGGGLNLMLINTEKKSKQALIMSNCVEPASVDKSCTCHHWCEEEHNTR